MAHGNQYVYSEKSLYCLDNKSKFRNNVVWIITHRNFEGFIIFLIILNSLMLAAYDYTDRENKGKLNQVLNMFEPVFVILFAIESVLKIIGMGFIMEKNSYLRDSWNWLDFIVVITGLLSFIPGMGNVSVLRTFRLFRPLKSLSMLPSM